MTDDDVLLDALDRLRGTEPEFDGFLANHGPMAAEALVRIGAAEVVPRWVDAYRTRLAPAPEPVRGLEDEDWCEHLGLQWTRIPTRCSNGSTRWPSSTATSMSSS